jgi:TonB-dependent starch-binding outer membrane protein SusC
VTAYNFINLNRSKLRKLLLIMRLTALLILIAALHVGATGHAQRVTISVKNASIENVFKEIRKQTGYQFLYNNQMLDKAKKVSITIQDATLNEALDICFADQPLTYEIVEKTIIIKVKLEIPNAGATNIAASIDVSGRITDIKGNPIPDANIMIKGTKRGTATDVEGRFKIAAEQGNVLEISAIGFGKKEIKVNGSQQINIALEIASSVLDEVQYIAYGTTSKRLSTSNIGSVKAADIEKQPVQNPLLALQARVPGLFISQPSGISGTGVNVRIQGQNSIANGNDPLFVVDGVPIDAQLERIGFEGAVFTRGGGYGSPLNYINPLDIESIEVLKDADATAIYGSRAANGALLITTKKGKAGAMRLDLNMQTGWGKMTRRVEMMNTRQYLDMRYEAFRNDNINWRDPSISANDLKVWDTTSYTNWQDELLGGTSRYSNINAAVSGGSSNLRYLVSGTYQKEKTIFPFPDFDDQKAAVHLNLNANNNDQKFRLQLSANYVFDDNKLPRIDLTTAALLKEPNAPPLLNADGSINWAPDASGNTTLGSNYSGNVMIQRHQKYRDATDNLLTNLKLEYKILPGLDIGSSFGYNQMQSNAYSTYPLIAVAPAHRSTAIRSAQFGNRNIQSWNVEPQANYRTSIGKGVIDMIIGSQFLSRAAASNDLLAKGQLTDEMLDNVNTAATIERGGGYSSIYRYLALFGRVNYNYADKYILNINARRDGSSRFGPRDRFHNFGSVAAAWIFSTEKFFRRYVTMISFAKLRGSFGTTGSDQIGDFRFLRLYNVGTSSVPYQGGIGLIPAGLSNLNLQWEETRKLQVGIDVGLFQDRLFVNATFVRNRCSNQILSYPLPSQTGDNGYQVNLPATIQNKNWEFVVTGKIIQTKSLVWTSTLNLTMPQNKLIKFPGLSTSTYARRLHLGKPMDVWGYYHWLGVAPGTGDYLYADKKGNPTLTPDPLEDNNMLLSFFPKYAGFENTLSYKGVQLTFIFQLVKQKGYYFSAAFNGLPYWFPGMFGAGVSNQPVNLLDRWQKPGDLNKSVARYSTISPTNVDILDSDRAYADASYIRLKNISLSWDLPQKSLHKAFVRSLQLYLHGQNLLTFTNYKGLDPEAQGLSLPPLQLCTVGIKMGI